MIRPSSHNSRCWNLFSLTTSMSSLLSAANSHCYSSSAVLIWLCMRVWRREKWWCWQLNVSSPPPDSDIQSVWVNDLEWQLLEVDTVNDSCVTQNHGEPEPSISALTYLHLAADNTLYSCIWYWKWKSTAWHQQSDRFQLRLGIQGHNNSGEYLNQKMLDY